MHFIIGELFDGRYSTVSVFYACRTGNDFNNENFAQVWANKTGGETYAYRGAFTDVGRSVVSQRG